MRRLRCRHGLLQRLSQFQAGGATGWLSWSMKPAAWAFSTFVKRPLTWGYGRVFSPAEPQSQEPDHFVVVGLVKVNASTYIVVEQRATSVHRPATRYRLPVSDTDWDLFGGDMNKNAPAIGRRHSARQRRIVPCDLRRASLPVSANI